MKQTGSRLLISLKPISSVHQKLQTFCPTLVLEKVFWSECFWTHHVAAQSKWSDWALKYFFFKAQVFFPVRSEISFMIFLGVLKSLNCWSLQTQFRSGWLSCCPSEPCSSSRRSSMNLKELRARQDFTPCSVFLFTKAVWNVSLLSLNFLFFGSASFSDPIIPNTAHKETDNSSADGLALSGETRG